MKFDLMSVNIQWSRSKYQMNSYLCYISLMSLATSLNTKDATIENVDIYLYGVSTILIIDFVCEIVDAKRSHSNDPILSKMS